MQINLKMNYVLLKHVKKHSKVQLIVFSINWIYNTLLLNYN